MISQICSSVEQLSSLESIPRAPDDPLYSIVTAYEADTFEKKVDLGVGAYRDDNGQPWILPVVKKVRNPSLVAVLFCPHR